MQSPGTRQSSAALIVDCYDRTEVARRAAVRLLRPACLMIALSFWHITPLPAAVVYHPNNPAQSSYTFPYPNDENSIQIDLDWNADAAPELIVSLSTHYSQVQVPENVNHRLAALLRPEGTQGFEIAYLTRDDSPNPSAPAALTTGDAIGPESSFSSSFSTTLFRGEFRTLFGTATPTLPGNFLTTDAIRYVGVKLDIEGEARYGWAGLSFNGGSIGSLNPGRVVVYGIAYEDSGLPIVAGQFADFATADFNRDGVVDGGDLAGWTGGFGEVNGADADGDSDSDGADFLAWQRQLGSSSLPTFAQPAALTVPEPATAAVAMVSAASAFFRFRNRRRE